MKSFAAVVVATAMQGVLALPAEPVPDREGPLPDDHVVNTREDLAGLRNSACYQNYEGQINPHGLIKYPCISELEIGAYCSDNFENSEKNITDVKGMQSCMFGSGSTFKTDYLCCIKCRTGNGDGAAGSYEANEKFIHDLEDLFVTNNEENRKYSQIAEELRGKVEPARVERTIPPGNINILEYCPSPQRPQHAGAPNSLQAPQEPQKQNNGEGKTEGATATIAAPKVANTSTPAAVSPKVAIVLIKSYMPALFSYGDSRLSANTSVTGNTAIAHVWTTSELHVCATCAAPNLNSITQEENQKFALDNTKLVTIKITPDLGTVQRFLLSDSYARDLPRIDKCRCFTDLPKGFTPTNDAAMSNGQDDASLSVSVGVSVLAISSITSVTADAGLRVAPVEREQNQVSPAGTPGKLDVSASNKQPEELPYCEN
ncbi:hypothetical protein HRG_001667 [Hirsutella rhossiliensis]|uniref:Uncharacterized protein n=1 Tax=Hirsutella rhossiliensis TaxID=111463 RepID=A0A9P8SKD7_9HYPO|nr:uncharacterized protein HRG_01667 [Hirsutella rhossiliensis]KAH0966258.1 hypothetical protein HRG_01667 [Hirsutella rhossiliensis]